MDTAYRRVLLSEGGFPNCSISPNTSTLDANSNLQTPYFFRDFIHQTSLKLQRVCSTHIQKRKFKQTKSGKKLRQTKKRPASSAHRLF
jgi:hypothetical protein